GSGSTAADSSGSGNNGSLVNSPSWTTGKVGGALSFNGGSAQVTTSLNPGSYPLSVCAWVYNSATGGLNNITSSLQFNFIHVGFGADYYQIYNNNSSINAGTAVLNSWQHVCATLAADGKAVVVYINGAQAGSGNFSSPQAA